MNKLVIITTPGGAKRDFVNTLHERTGGNVALVIVQLPRKRPLAVRIRKFVEKVGYRGAPREIFYFLLMRFSLKRREALNLLKVRTPLAHSESEYLPPVMYTTDVNGEEVLKRVLALAPQVMAIWGGLIIQPQLLRAATTVVNIHTGYCPYYRGTNCNLHAMLNDDLDHIGITLHDAVPEVDAGPVRALITTSCHHRAPSDFMRELNDRAFNAYVELVCALLRNEEVPSKPQDQSVGKNYRLKEWTYEKQYRASGIVNALEVAYGNQKRP